MLIRIQDGSNSYQARPCRAEVGWAWWLLCQPSPKVISATHQLLRESSRVSNRRRAPHVRARSSPARWRAARKRRAGRRPTASCGRPPMASRISRQHHRWEPNDSCSARRRTGAWPDPARTWTSARCCCDWPRRTESSPCAPTRRRRAASADRPADRISDGGCGASPPRKSGPPSSVSVPQTAKKYSSAERHADRTGACAGDGSPC